MLRRVFFKGSSQVVQSLQTWEDNSPLTGSLHFLKVSLSPQSLTPLGLCGTREDDGGCVYAQSIGASPVFSADLQAVLTSPLSSAKHAYEVNSQCLFSAPHSFTDRF